MRASSPEQDNYAEACAVGVRWRRVHALCRTGGARAFARDGLVLRLAGAGLLLVGARGLLSWSTQARLRRPQASPLSHHASSSQSTLGTWARRRASVPKRKVVEPIAINHSSAAELQRLPGIGPALAKRIVAQRERIGGFDRIEDLQTVLGIGPARLERLRPYVAILGSPRSQTYRGGTPKSGRARRARSRR